ncbi:hypothetical protein HK105_200202 [Polyrhizophydium stewartii]|uniref:Uncharacterized protein n=1 Tax=Polyrhizophydium stewartii TaxID=2732419 RepID=A0ABR4NKU2_9FUNG
MQPCRFSASAPQPHGKPGLPTEPAASDQPRRERRPGQGLVRLSQALAKAGPDPTTLAVEMAKGAAKTAAALEAAPQAGPDHERLPPELHALVRQLDSGAEHPPPEDLVRLFASAAHGRQVGGLLPRHLLLVLQAYSRCSLLDARTRTAAARRLARLVETHHQTDAVALRASSLALADCLAQAGDSDGVGHVLGAALAAGDADARAASARARCVAGLDDLAQAYSTLLGDLDERDLLAHRLVTAAAMLRREGTLPDGSHRNWDRASYDKHIPLLRPSANMDVLSDVRITFGRLEQLGAVPEQWVLETLCAALAEAQEHQARKAVMQWIARTSPDAASRIPALPTMRMRAARLVGIAPQVLSLAGMALPSVLTIKTIRVRLTEKSLQLHLEQLIDFAVAKDSERAWWAYSLLTESSAHAVQAGPHLARMCGPIESSADDELLPIVREIRAAGLPALSTLASLASAYRGLEGGGTSGRNIIEFALRRWRVKHSSERLGVKPRELHAILAAGVKLRLADADFAGAEAFVEHAYADLRGIQAAPDNPWGRAARDALLAAHRRLLLYSRTFEKTKSMQIQQAIAQRFPAHDASQLILRGDSVPARRKD